MEFSQEHLSSEYMACDICVLARHIVGLFKPSLKNMECFSINEKIALHAGKNQQFSRSGIHFAVVQFVLIFTQQFSRKVEQ